MPKRLSEPQRRALREIAEHRVKQDRVARFYLDGLRNRARERSYRAVIYHGLARHRSASVATKAKRLPIQLTDAGREADHAE